jgi:flagellar biosynthesis/type III secretory pathway protein FliH
MKGMRPLSNVKKSCGIVLDGRSGGYYLESGNLMGKDERDTISRKSLDQELVRSQNSVADAELMLKQTIIKGRDFIGRAQAEAEVTVNKSKEQGHAKGYEEGFKLAIEESVSRACEEKIPIIEAISELEARFSNYCASKAGNSEYIECALQLAQKIIYIELAKNDEAFFHLYQKAAMHIGNAEKATLKTGPRGYALTQAEREKFEGEIDGIGEFVFTLEGEDDGLCVLETPLGNVDASVGAQIGRVRQIILPQE